jgi:hypothetical protein
MLPSASTNDAARTTGLPARQRVAAWLLLCCALVFAMVVVGGVTRLTHSGLSIVEWQPIVGTLPPLTDDAWQEAFAKYQATPEYRKVNAGMALLAVVGQGMVHHVGIAAKIFSALAEVGVNIRMIDQGSSELNIIIGVEEGDFARAVNAIYFAVFE